MGTLGVVLWLWLWWPNDWCPGDWVLVAVVAVGRRVCTGHTGPFHTIRLNTPLPPFITLAPVVVFPCFASFLVVAAETRHD